METKQKLTQKEAYDSAATQPRMSFPVHPMYAAGEDMMNYGRRVDADMQAINTEQNPAISISKSELPSETIDGEDDGAEEHWLLQDEFSLTKDDLQALGPADLNLSMDMGEDEEMKHRTRPVDFSAGDLDIPGSELDDASEAVGSEDEENYSYSLGEDDHDDLEKSIQAWSLAHRMAGA